MKHPKILITGILIVVCAVFIAVTGQWLVETNNAGYTHVKQAAVSGEMSVRHTAGMYAQLFGKITEYKQAATYTFGGDVGDGDAQQQRGTLHSPAVSIRFNDGAKASIVGSVRLALPSDDEHMLQLHAKFRSFEGVTRNGVQKVVDEAITLTAALMTAEESYTTGRAQFSEMAWDQVNNGVYLTERLVVDSVDEVTGAKTSRATVHIKRDTDGNVMRKDNPLEPYGVRLSQFVISDINYEQSVQAQIAAKRGALMDVVKAKANAEKAIQDRKTAEEVGRKNVSVAEYEAEVTKKKAVVEAEKKKQVAELDAAQKLAVAELDTKSAALEKKAKILRADADAEAARKKFQADGALNQKLETLRHIHQVWANAYTQQRPTPDISMGGAGNGGTANPASAMMEAMGVNALKQLQLDMRIQSTRTAPPGRGVRQMSPPARKKHAAKPAGPPPGGNAASAAAPAHGEKCWPGADGRRICE